jgi:hypothetical protein
LRLSSALETDYDVIVLGAGISGLLLASALSADHRVLVLEKANTLGSSKYWLTDHNCSAFNPELSAGIDSVYPHMDFIGYDRTSYRCQGPYVLWDKDGLVGLLQAKIAANRGTFLTGHHFYSYFVNPSSCTVLANDKSFSTRLIIDCMGYASPIIYAKNVIDIYGYYLLYGATFFSSRPIDPVALHNVALDKHPAYIEAFPTRDARLHLTVIIPSKTARSVGSLKEQFAFITRKSTYASFIDTHKGSPEFLGGIIPVGMMRRRAIDRLFFFGEAGQFNPPASATALTRMLYTYKATAKFLTEKLRTNSLSRRDLNHGPPAFNWFNRRFQLGLFEGILRWDSDDFSSVLGELRRTGDDSLVNDIMFGSLGASSVLSPPAVLRLCRARSSKLLMHALRGVIG